MNIFQPVVWFRDFDHGFLMKNIGFWPITQKV